MRNLKKFVPAIFIAVSLILSIGATLSPLWSIRTSRGQEITTKKSIDVYYMPLQTVVVTQVGTNYFAMYLTIVANDFGNHTSSLNDTRASLNGDDIVDIFDLVEVATDFKQTSFGFALTDWIDSGEARNEMASLISSTLIISIVGIVFAISALAVFAFSIFRKPFFGTATFLAAIAGILLLVAPMYFTVQSIGIFERFSTVVPARVSYLELSTFSGRNIGSFWGSTQDWTWGAGAGWFLLFVSSLFLFSSFVLIRSHSKLASPAV